MTELEQKLASALEQLGMQYAEDMKRLSEQVQRLSSQLEEQSKTTSKQVTHLTGQVQTLIAAYNKLSEVWNEEFK